MASGITTTTQLASALPTVFAGARSVREYAGVNKLAEQRTLGVGMGLSWSELTMAQLTASAVGESQETNNPQTYSVSSMSITPSMIQIEVLVTDRVRNRIDKAGFAEMGKQLQHACERKKDTDFLVNGAAATTVLGGAGVTMVSGHIASATERILSNTTECGYEPVFAVIHGYHRKDLFDELTAGVGVSNVPEGATADVYKNGYTLPVAGTKVFIAGNMTIDSAEDAVAFVFAKAAIIKVQGKAPGGETKREPGWGGGADRLYYRDEYAYGERSAGNWLYGIKADAAVPTS